MLLPDTNRILALLILHLLYLVSENSAVNKMTPANLGIIFGPLMLRDDGTLHPLEAMSRVTIFSDVVAFLVEVSEELFHVRVAV